MAMAAPSSTGPQVFINFRGSDMRYGFLGYLVTALRKANIKVFTDNDEFIGTSLQNLLLRIQESQIALAIFSKNYTSSTMCLDELVKINECEEQRGLIAVPIFYKIKPSKVEHLDGKFGDVFRALKRSHGDEPLRTQKWEKALTSICQIAGKHLRKDSDTDDECFIKGIVEGIQRTLLIQPMEENSSKEAKVEGEISGKQAREANDKMIIARELEITDSESPEKWNWSSIYDEPNSLLPHKNKTFTVATSWPVGLTSTGPQVFINFRESDLRNRFIGFLMTALRNANIIVYDAKDNMTGELDNVLVRIEESKLAIAIFSESYTSSTMCLDELVKIKECMDEGGLTVIPIFYKVEPSMVRNLEGHFGDAFRALKRSHRHEPEIAKKWKEALTSIPQIQGGRLSENSDLTDGDFIKMVVKGVKRALWHISMKENLSREANNIQVALMVTARQLVITHSESPQQWIWSSISEEPNNAGVEIATMIYVDWLKIVGKFTTSDLTPGKEYEMVFVVKLEDTAYGWECPVYLKLKLEQHNGSASREVKAVNLTNYIGYGWVNIRAGVFVAPPKNAVATGTVTMYQYMTDDRKGGLVIKGVAIRPTN